MNDYTFAKYFGFSQAESEIESMASEGWLICGISWCVSLTKDIFVVAYQRGEPIDIEVTIEKYFGFDNAERAMTLMGREGWEVAGTHWLGSLKDILIVAYVRLIN